MWPYNVDKSHQVRHLKAVKKKGTELVTTWVSVNQGGFIKYRPTQWVYTTL